MPWTTPTLKETRRLVRDYVLSQLGAVAMIPNSMLRIMSDAKAALTHLTLLYLDWLSRQFLPDTAEEEWLERHGNIWLKNADGSIGRKAATYAVGSVTVTGVDNTIIPINSTLTSASTLTYQTTAEAEIGSEGTVEVPVRCLTPGVAGNLDVGERLTLQGVSGADQSATVITLTGGTEVEPYDLLRERTLFRIQQPPMGGDADDYVAWAKSIAGVTRAWASVEMGIGTVTVRFMMDDLRAGQGGFPNNGDIALVQSYLDTVRPVTVKDLWVLAPVPEPINFTVKGLDSDTASIRAGIEDSVRDMLLRSAAPAHIVNGVQQQAETIYEAWVSDAIMNVAGVKSFKLLMEDHPMPYNGSLAVLGTVLYDR